MYAKGTIDRDAREATLFCSLWKDVQFIEPEIKTFFETVDGGVVVTLNTKNYARCVNLAVSNREDVEYSDNYFDILPGCEKKILVKGNDVDTEDIVIRNWLDKWNF